MNEKITGKKPFVIGLISDTHGLLRPDATDALQTSDLIIHAGDVGKITILDELNEIAPVIAVRGNMDNESWAYKLKKTEVFESNKLLFYVIHDLNRLDLDPVSSHISAVINGHTHRPLIQRHKKVLYINPGSAGPRRSVLPPTVALIHVQGKSLDARIVELKE